MCPLWESSIQFSESFMSCFFFKDQTGEIHWNPFSKMKPWRLDGDDSLWRLCQWAVHSGIAVVEVNDSVLGQTIFEAVKIGLWLPGERHFEWWGKKTMKECLVCIWGPFHEGPVHRGKCPSAGSGCWGEDGMILPYWIDVNVIFSTHTGTKICQTSWEFLQWWGWIRFI